MSQIFEEAIDELEIVITEKDAVMTFMLNDGRYAKVFTIDSRPTPEPTATPEPTETPEPTQEPVTEEPEKSEQPTFS